MVKAFWCRGGESRLQRSTFRYDDDVVVYIVFDCLGDFAAYDPANIMTAEQCCFLSRILMKSYDHNIRIRAIEKAAKGLVRRGGDKRQISLDGLRFEIAEDVLDFLGVPADETRRKHFRHLLEMAGKVDPDPHKIEERLRKIEAEVGRMFN